MVKGLTWMNKGVLGNTIGQARRSARDVCTMAVTICARRLPIQRETLPYPAAAAISCQELCMLGFDALHMQCE